MLRMRALFEWDGLNGMNAMIQCGMNVMAMEFFGSTHEPLRKNSNVTFQIFQMESIKGVDQWSTIFHYCIKSHNNPDSI